MEDYKGQEGVKIATVFAKSAVSLGYLVDGARAQRGAGLEARTDGHAVLRGGAGVLLTADRQGEPDRPHLEMQGAWTQLQAALALAAALSEVARRATAELAQVKAQQAQLETAFQDLREAVVLLSAPHGIGVATPKSIQLASGEHVAVGAGGSADFSLGQSLTVAAQQAVSLLAVRGGVKVLAQQGKVDVQAQGGAMRVFAEEDVKITSADGHVAIDAAKSITLRAGRICLKLERGNVTLMCPGDFKVHSASFCSKGPMSVQEQGRETKEVGDLHVTCRDSNGEPMAGEALSLLNGEGAAMNTTTDAQGRTSLSQVAFDYFEFQRSGDGDGK
jgi:type VI secretion system secreted protein VgrG